MQYFSDSNELEIAAAVHSIRCLAFCCPFKSQTLLGCVGKRQEIPTPSDAQFVPLRGLFQLRLQPLNRQHVSLSNFCGKTLLHY